MANKTSNVIIRKWWPQPDVLGHPNVKLYIMQGGLQSLEESIVKQVPMLVMPFIADQYFNSERIANLQIGRTLDIRTLTKNKLKEAILDIIQNPKYKKNIIKISRIGSDQPMDGLEKAVWWTEYVIRNKGAEYIKSNDVDFPWYQFLLLDVICFLLAATLIFLYLCYTFISLVVNLIVIYYKSSKIKIS